MKRYISLSIAKDLEKKPVLLSGPRQSGKTFLSKSLDENDYDYLNFDILKDRKRLLSHEWFRNRKLVIFDEIHKMKKWKNWLKGIFDSDEEVQKFLVTGSAKLTTYKKVGDSLAGRYLSYRLYPLDLKELLDCYKASPSEFELPMKKGQNINEVLLDRLLAVSGFPEPFFAEESTFYPRWQQTHLDVILKQDILETQNVKSIKQLETLTLLLGERVGSPLSYNSLREDLSTDDKSVKRWVDILEDSYVVFRIYPYTNKSLIHALKQFPKIYFFDYGRTETYSQKLENLVALSLLKEIHFRLDTKGEKYDLQFLQNKQLQEVDFLVLKNKKPHMMIEVKESDPAPSANFFAYEKWLPGLKKVQLVKNLKDERVSKSGVLISPMSKWLATMEL